MGISAVNPNVTQDTVNKDQQAVEDAAKNNGDVKAAVQTLIVDQAALNDKTGSTGATLVDAKNYMDQFLKKDGVSTKGLDDAFKDTPHMTDSSGKMYSWDDKNSLDTFAQAVHAQIGLAGD